MSLIISNPKNFIINESLMSKLMSAFETISLQEGLSNSSINMRIVDDKEMTALNKKFRNKDSSTNV